jgi:hypothetical protein
MVIVTIHSLGTTHMLNRRGRNEYLVPSRATRQPPTTGVNVVCLPLCLSVPAWRAHGARAAIEPCDNATTHIVGARCS